MINKITVITKRLSANDLGETGSHQAGILVPKAVVRLNFFPYLDPEEYNPSVEILTFCEELNQTNALRYVYYNGKTRNEYRITRMTKLLRDLDAAEGDLLIFSHQRAGEMLLTIKRCNSNSEENIQDKSANYPINNTTKEVTELKNGWTMEEITEGKS